jgi:chemotaxis response regulator CheB
MIYYSAKVRKKLHIGYGKYSFGTNQQVGAHEKNLKPFDFFLKSIADSFCGRILVVLLSGADIGDIEGLRRIKEKSGRIIVEEPDSCVVPFSLERVIQAKLADLETSPFKIANQIVDYTSSNPQNHLKI